LVRGGGAGYAYRVALGEGIRLHDERRLLDLQREVALADRDAADADVRPHDDGAGPLVHHDAGAPYGLDEQVLDAAVRMGGRPHAGGADVERDGARIGQRGDRAPEPGVDQLLDPACAGEIRTPERAAHGMLPAEPTS